MEQQFHANDGSCTPATTKRDAVPGSDSGGLPICEDSGSIGRVFHAFPAPLEELTWEDAQVGPSVHSVPLLGYAVCDEEAAGAGLQTLAAVNACWREHGGMYFRIPSPNRL